MSSVSGTATERNRGVPEPWLEWSSGDPLFQPGGQGAPLRSGCSGLWLQHCQGQSLQDLSGQPVLVFDCCHGEESSPDVYLEVPPSSWCLVPPPHCPSPPRTAWSHLCILCPEPALRSPLCLLLLPKSHLSPVLPLSHSPAPALWTFSEPQTGHSAPNPTGKEGKAHFPGSAGCILARTAWDVALLPTYQQD